MKREARKKIAQRMRERWARIRAEQPEKYAAFVAAAKERYWARRGKKIDQEIEDLSGKQVSENAMQRPMKEEKDWEEPQSPAQIAYVSEIPVNPRLVFARNDVCERFEVLVGRNSVLWVDCPMEIRPSLDFPGYYEFVGELPHGRWDRHYALRFGSGN
jgi:hypothetical protein